MRLRLAIAAALACTGFVTIAPTVGHALVELDITALPVDRYSMGAGFDPETTSDGLNYECTSSGSSTKRNLKKAFEESLEDLLTQFRAHLRAREVDSAATWKPIQPSPLQCTFTTTEAFTNMEEKTTANNEAFGRGWLVTNCDQRKEVTVAFQWNAVLPTTLPTDGRGPLPSTSASNWTVTYAGFKQCTWFASFNDGDDTLSGTLYQDFTTVPQTQPTLSYNCVNPQGKDLCVSYSYPTTLTVTGGTGGNDSVNLNEVTCTACTMTETRVATMSLLNMPFAVSALAGQSIRSGGKPRLVIEGVSAAAAKASSALNLSLKKSKSLSVRLASPMNLKGTRTLGKGPDGRATKLKFASAPGASCGLTARSGKKSVTILPSKRTMDGAVNTNVTASSLRAKLGIKSTAAAKVSVVVSCATGSKRKSETSDVTLEG